MTEEIINKDELKKLRVLLESGQRLAISTKEFEKVFDEIDRLEQENRELKGRCQKLSEDLSCSNGCLRNKIDIEIIYRSALEEIRDIADKCKECLNEDDDCRCDYLRIKHRIDEVLGND